LGALKTKSWSNAWQEQIVDAAQRLPNRIAEMQSARDNLLEATGLNIHANDSQGVSALCALVEAIRQTYGQSFRFAFAVDNAATAEAAAKATAILAEHQGLVAKLSVPFGDIPGIAVPALEMEWELANKKFWFLATSAKKKLAAKLAAQGSAAGTPDPASDLPRLRRIQHLAGELSTLAPRLHDVPGWDGLNTDAGRMTAAIATAATLKAAITVTASTPDDLSAMTQAAIRLAVEANGLLAPEGRIAQTHEACIAALARLAEISAQFTSLIVEEASLNTLGLLATAVVSNQPRLKSWCDWKRVSDEALLAGLQPLLHAVEQGAAPTALSDLFETAYARWFAAQLIDAEPRLAQFMPDVHASDIETFRKLEDTLSRLAVRYIRAQICGRIPNKNDVGKKDGYGILKHQLQLQRRHKPIRQLAAEMGDAFTRLAPCMLMSPLSIAQYLPPDQALFDLVIFDEASQIAPWDAVGAMARGRQVVIAGDPRQMPPTNFFGRAAAEDDTVDGDESDMESILDECLGAGLPQHTLEWHYRSQHESLIAFSNSRYYENRLITFPAPVTRASAVSWRRVDGVYAKGKGRTNQAEAEAMVAEVVTRLTDAEFAASGKTLGIIVLNADQQKLIEDLLDQARRREPALERFFGEAALEPVFVKNLETVQGDERDIILIGIGFGPTEPGAPVMSMNFGPLNRDGGWRRLNVAITRARAEMMLFTSFDSAMVDLNRTSARAVRDLKHFIEFAERGPRSLAEAVHGSVGGFDSPFEEAVADALTRKGWQVVTQIGVSRFRIDLGIVHPDRPGDYLVGVECDGAAYHSAATARDRDKVRQAILETLGWKLLRIWSTDWWVDKAGATEKLHAAISALLEADRARRGPDDDEVELAAAD
jgi:very-short-patch-repair endonuclease